MLPADSHRVNRNVDREWGWEGIVIRGTTMNRSVRDRYSLPPGVRVTLIAPLGHLVHSRHLMHSGESTCL